MQSMDDPHLGWMGRERAAAASARVDIKPLTGGAPMQASTEAEVIDREILRYSRQVVLEAMDRVRASMRGDDRLVMRLAVDNDRTVKDGTNRTKAIDQEIEDLMIASL